MKAPFVWLVNGIADTPTRAMEISIGFIFMLDGLYVMSPFYQIARTSPLQAHPGDEQLQFVIGACYVLLGGLAFASSVFSGGLKYRRLAAMALFLAALFATIFRVHTLGWHPSGWIFNLMVTLVFVFDWLHINKWLSSQPSRD